MEIQILEFLGSKLGCEPFKWGFYTGWFCAVLIIYFMEKALGSDAIFNTKLFSRFKKGE